MNILKNELLEHHGFLKLTRENPLEMNSSCQHYIDNFEIKLQDTGVLLFEPCKPGSTDIVISSGIHGNETAPIEICDLLVSEILSGRLTVNNRVLFIIGNPLAMNKGKRFEIENLNRLFCGKHMDKKHPEARRAARLEQFTREFFGSRETVNGVPVERCHFDLHTAIRTSKYEKFAIYPYQDGRDWKKYYLDFFKDSGITTILFAHQSAGTFSYFSSHEFQANAFTVELGKVKPFGENNMSSFSALINNLRALISNTYKSTADYDSDCFQNKDFNLYQVVDEVMKTSETKFSLNIGSNIANFTQFPVGFQLTTDDNSGYQIKSEQHAIVFPNAAVPTGHRVVLIIEKTTI